MKPLFPAALAAAATAAVLAVSAHGASAPAQLKFVVTDKHIAVNDVDPPGVRKHPSLGDTIYLAGTISDGATGHYGLACQVTKPGNKSGEDVCTGDLALAKGDLTILGRIPFSGKNASLAITGGTGAYAGATGTLDSHSLGHERTAIEIHLES